MRCARLRLVDLATVEARAASPVGLRMHAWPRPSGSQSEPPSTRGIGRACEACCLPTYGVTTISAPISSCSHSRLKSQAGRHYSGL